MIIELKDNNSALKKANVEIIDINVSLRKSLDEKEKELLNKEQAYAYRS